MIHEGTVRLTLGDRVVEAEPGTTMFVPPGTWHGGEAHGDAEATMLFIFPEPDSLRPPGAWCSGGFASVGAAGNVTTRG